MKRIAIAWCSSILWIVWPAVTSMADVRPEEIVSSSGKAVVLIVTEDADGSAGQGTGFLVSPDGLVVTNEHVVRGATLIAVRRLNHSTPELAHVVISDRDKDLAVIRISGHGLPTLRLGDSVAAAVGSRIYVIGNPEGLLNTVSDGLLSGRREIAGRRMLQISAPISPGSSGSPVFDSGGRVIGVVVGFLSDGQSLNLALPIRYVRAMLARCGETKRASQVGHGGARQRLASRGLDLLWQYAAATRWFTPRLSEAAAWRLAQSITFYSVRYHLDARLLLALIVGEGLLEKVQRRTGGLSMGTTRVEPGIAVLARDLRRCLNRAGASGTRTPTWEQIKLALGYRYAQLRRSSRQSGRASARIYVAQIGRRYYQMCGLTPPADTLVAALPRPSRKPLPGTAARKYPEATAYFAVRDVATRVITDVTFARVQKNAARWKGALIEVRGLVWVCERRNRGGTLTIVRDDGDCFVVDAQQKLPSPTCDFGQLVRVLARIPKDQSSFSHLELVAVTSEYEAASLEFERAK